MAGVITKRFEYDIFKRNHLKGTFAMLNRYLRHDWLLGWHTWRRWTASISLLESASHGRTGRGRVEEQTKVEVSAVALTGNGAPYQVGPVKKLLLNDCPINI